MFVQQNKFKIRASNIYADKQADKSNLRIKEKC